MAGKDAGAPEGSGKRRRVYGCSDAKAAATLTAWYETMKTTAWEVWSVNAQGNLHREIHQIALRRELVVELCIRPREEDRISPLQIARDAGVSDSTVFTILARELRDRTGVDDG